MSENVSSADNIITHLYSQKKSLTKKELAQLLGISIRTLERKMENREIPYVNFCGVKFDPVQIARWWQARTVTVKK